MDPILKQYIEQLNPKEQIALRIAKEQLESSFEIEKSLGYLIYLSNLSKTKVVTK
tara:strand:+ start:359 stop:523 length:165 start_codon:yes stop_codon:yes gene_type:complete